ncbi:MAG: Eco57I restriction-modification methylase domain-containing protein [Gudongella sp.]|nr:Eco57I restriction-modification methylase domain-containing protein [Gudongella sp.]
MADKFFKNAFEYKVIYIFTIGGSTHRGLLKIGDATLSTETSIDHLTPNCHELNQSSLKRIKEYTNTVGLTPKILWSEVATRTVRQKDGTIKLEAFRDYQVHAVLKNSNINHTELGQSREWFEIDIETAKKAIEAVKLNRANLSSSDVVKQAPIIFRPEQVDCIEKVVKHFKKADRFLINAKMRYGKTFVSLEIIKRCNYKKTIIITHRPVVDAGWYLDFTKIFYGTEYIYGSKAKGSTVEQLIASDKPFIYFASVQDLRGSSIVGGKFDKNDIVFSTVWDCVTVDEAHEGTTTALGEDTVNAVFKKGSGTKFIALSGTPFNILQDYDEDSIYTWDYIMEQECKSEWDLLHFGDSNPYDELPELRIYTYSLGDILRTSNYITFEDKAFNFKEFFRVFTGDFSVDYADMPVGAEIGDFVHEADVWSFLNLMTKQDDNSYYPYSNEEYRALFKHSLWMVPGIKEARALKKLMLKHPVFGCGQFNIVNVAGNGDEEEAYEEALLKVRKAIKEAGEDYTITLSCGKLTTGVTVKEWTAVFMLAGSYSTSATNYLQTIFRVQSPCNENGRIKEKAYVFDFAPDRTLKMVSSAVSISTKTGKTKLEDKQIMGKFLNYCPVIGISGSDMQEFSATRLLQQLKKAYADRVVRNGFDDSSLYNDELFKLQAIDIEKFDALKAIIGASKAQPKTNDFPVNAQGLTDEEYEESEKLGKKKRGKQPLTEEEKARFEELKRLKKVRNDAISILRGISIRMPLLIYGADIPYDEEIMLDRFVDVVDDFSWDEFMPAGVTKEKFKEFQKYYDEEVFIAAGRRIRNIAREADTLDPTERVIKIASLFSFFKNPDKETVLTPWSVVNMHMSDCLGGWDFWDEQHREPLDFPRFVDRGEVTAKTFGVKDAQILEINSKTGLYPLYVAYSCYRMKIKALGDKTLTIADKQVLWIQTVEENVYVICKTPMAKAITTRTLLGYADGKVNAHSFDDLLNTITNKPGQFRKRVLRGNFWGKGVKDMRFDAVVGNPPYQEETIKQVSEKNGQAPRRSIFHYFQMAADEVSSGAVSLIYPGARWIHRSGKGMAQFGLNQINDITLERIDFYPDSEEIFKDVAIADGITMVYKNKNKQTSGFTYVYHKDGKQTSVFMENPGENLIPLNPKDRIIVQKVATFVENHLLAYIHDRVFPRNLFGIESNFVENNPSLVRELNDNNPFNFDTEVKLFTNDKAGKAGRSKWFLADKSIITNNPEKISEWQVVVSSANAGGQKRDNQIEVIDNHSAFGRSRVALGSFKTNIEAINFYNYCKTYLIRFMFLMTDESLTSLGKKVPDIGDYKKDNQLVDFSQDLNAQIYELFGLTKEECSYIEEVINSR